MLGALRLLVVYSGACTAVVWLVVRFLRPLPRSLALVLVLAPFLLTGPAMVTGGYWGALNLAYNSVPYRAQAENLPRPREQYDNGILLDQICQVVPWRKAVRESVKTGHWPIYNRFVRGGDILLAAAQPAPFDPKVWIGFLLPLATAVTFACSFVLFQTVLFAFLYLSEIGLRTLPALFGAAVWMLSGFVSFWVGWSLSSVWAVLPLVLLGIRRIVRGRRGGFGAATAGWLLALVGGHPESVLHLGAAAGLSLLWELGSVPRRLDGALLGKIGRCLGSGLLACLLAAPALLPFIEALPQTADFGSRSAGIRHALPLDDVLRSALGAVFPYGWGAYPPGSSAGATPPRFTDAGFAFVGGLPMLFALLGLASRRTERWLFGGLGLFAFAVALGFPGLAHVVGVLPLFDLTLNGRLAGVAAFCLAGLAALGLEHALERPGRGLWAFLTCGALLLLLGGAWRDAVMERSGIVTGAHQASVLWMVAPVLIAVVCGLLLRGSARLGAIYLVLAVLSLRFAAPGPSFRYTFPARLFYPPLQELEVLPEAGEPFRVVGRGYDLVPAQSALLELEDVRGFHVMGNRRLVATFPLWCTPMAAWYCRIDDPNRPFLSLMNVRYLMSAPDRRRPRGRWRRVVRGPNLALYENRRALPRAFVPRRVRFVPPSPESARRVLAEMAQVEDFGDTAWIEVPDGRFSERANGRAEVSTRADGPDLLVEVRAEATSWVVVSQTFWKGWRALDENGESLPLHFADHAFLAFEARRGEHHLRLSYRPRSFTLGLALCSLAVAGLSIAWSLREWRRRSSESHGAKEPS